MRVRQQEANMEYEKEDGWVLWVRKKWGRI